ncbi:MAG TPA: hypothetical protein DCL61_22785 [Cyanobacteria bacterium UBA12227]|nr:hypothetical protein [Cyanobacteria bacterium UBA12227]HAX85761.1 hypothetical protein [Cyanobacteria bacterium UBA11370]HBY79600.1 hypothetical protein [Cyanobacteria bacterium UBA11148]
MKTTNYGSTGCLEEIHPILFREKNALKLRQLTKNVPLNQWHYVFLLCYLVCKVSTEEQAKFTQFLDDYVANYLAFKILRDSLLQQLINNYLSKFCLNKSITKPILKSYIKQYYKHLVQDLHTEPDLYLEFVLKLIHNSEERSKLFAYILGCEIIKMMFQMSWLQHERLYQLQKNQEGFINSYIKPIQYAHRLHAIIVPKDERVFFAKRDYFIKRPKIAEPKLIELVMYSFTQDTITNLGLLIIRNLNFFVFDYEYIFNAEPECIFQL